MGWDGSGNVVRNNGTNTGQSTWQDDAAANAKIRSDRHDTHDQDLADAIENTVALDGQTTTTTDNDILRFDSGQLKFVGVSVGANSILARSGSTDLGATSLSEQQVIGREGGDIAAISIGALGKPSSLSILKGLTTTPFSDGDVVYLRGRSSVGDGGEGHFRWDSSDLSTEVGNDEVTAGEGDGGIYVAPDSDKTGASGAWVRLYDQQVDPAWWGVSDGGDILALVSFPADVLNDGDLYEAPGFYNRGDGGGGTFYWDGSQSKSNANGGTIIDPDNTGGFDGTASTVDSFLSAQGTGSGTGCWILSQRHEAPVDQTDYVDRVNAMIRPEDVYARYDGSNLIVSVMESREAGGERFGVEYTLAEDADGFLLLDSIQVGEATLDTYTVTATSSDVTGTWTTSTANFFTETVGDTFEVSVGPGDKIELNVRKDDKGGIWEVQVVDGDDIIAEKTVTCYSASGGAVRVVIAEGLDRGTYTVRGEFKGDDPYNAPSGGTSRGYIRADTEDTAIATDHASLGDLDSSPDVVMDSTVQEFAIKARPDGASEDTDWIPSHSGVTGAAVNIGRKVYIGGSDALQTITGADYTNLPGYPVECERFTLVQRYDAQNSNEGTTTLWEGFIAHEFTRDGLRTSHRLLFKNDTEIGNAYLYMMGAKQGVVPKLKISQSPDHTVYTATASGSSQEIAAHRSALRYGTDFVAGQYPVYATTVADIKASLNTGRSYARPQIQGALLTDRADNVTKLYHYAGQNGSVIPSGVVWHVETRTTAGIARNPMDRDDDGVGVA